MKAKEGNVDNERSFSNKNDDNGNDGGTCVYLFYIPAD